MYTIPSYLPSLLAFQWATIANPNPTLSAPLSPTDTTAYFSTPPYDHAGAVATPPFLIGIKNADSYVMTGLITAMAVDGLSGTIVQGIRLEGLDYTTSDTTLIPAEGFSAGDAVFCNISGVIQALTIGAIRGVIATNGLGFIIGDGTASNATISHKDNASTKGFLRKNPTNSKVQYSNDGTNWVNIDSVSASNLIQVSAADTTPGYAETKIVAGSNISITKLNAGANESLSISTTLGASFSVPATYTPAYLTGDNTSESNYLLWLGTANGTALITINGVARSLLVDFTTGGITNMAGIATKIQTALRALTGALETVAWSTDHFIISSVDTTATSAITVTSATGSGTDISGVGAFGGLGCDVGHGVITAKVLNQAADAGKILLADTGGLLNEQISLPSQTSNSGKYLTTNGTASSWASPIYTDSQVFTASGTWTKPANVKFVQVVCIGAGGSGGGGPRHAWNNASMGGSGGGGGAARSGVFLAASLGATETVTVGATTTGGAGAVADNGAGSNGSNGAASSFGTWLTAGGGGYGTGGGAGSCTGGGGGGVLTSASGSTGGTPTSTTAGISGQGVTAPANAIGLCADFGGGTGGGNVYSAFTGGTGGSSIMGAGGGGCGGGWDTAGNYAAPGAGGACGSYTAGGGAGEANSTTKKGYSGNGSAGTSAIRGAASVPASGGIPGGGGGGAGVSENGNTAAIGGAGARGEVRVYAW